ncbi:hypothetical protein [Microbacterium oxydans]|uniref:hypothetical protein n=1 Tax=Microbacterium oxydans TaxID=82380 RepID=UPI00226B915B|nr:hypothetical protein [Microbacterium oxydans]WAA64688.1 hypothetical protein MME74_10555 [Microbacterium oxydans]
MSNPIIPPVPPIPHDDDPAGVPTQDVDGERVLDPDVDDALIDSAEADRVAAETDDDADADA